MSMNEKNGHENQEVPQTVTDDQIATERKLSRRSLLTMAGAVFAGGAVAMLADRRAGAQVASPQTGTDPDQAKGGKPSDPDSKKGGMRSDPDSAKHKHKHKHHGDPDSKKGMKASDPDKAKGTMGSDPDRAKTPPPPTK